MLNGRSKLKLIKYKLGSDSPYSQPKNKRILLRWLVPGIHVKRWIGLFILSILFIDLGLAYMLRHLYITTGGLPWWTYWVTLQFISREFRALIFGVLGIALMIFSIFRLSRSLITPILQVDGATLAERIYTYRALTKGPKIVAIGGGTGLSTLLRGLKEYTSNLTAIVTVADDGGSSGILIREYNTLPPGDFRQCLTALADAEPLMTQLFQHRFKEGSLNGHSFGNLFILAMAEVTGNFEQAIRESGRVLAVRGKIVPSTLHNVVLCAETQDGRRVEGESKIPVQAVAIKRVFLEPQDAKVNPEAVISLMNADLIVVGPGSLYTSILPNLLVEGMAEAIISSNALKVYVCNIATQPGETDGYAVSDHLQALSDHLGRDIFDYVVVNSNLNFSLPAPWQKVIPDTYIAKRGHQPKFVYADLLDREHLTHHDPQRLAETLVKVILKKRD